MNQATDIFENLKAPEVEWMLSTGTERSVASGEVIITAGKAVDSLYIVLRGLVGIAAPEFPERKLAMLGPAEVIGDMTLAEAVVPTESVVALEESQILALPHALLNERLKADPDFAARFFRGLAKLLSNRLRRANAQLAAALRVGHPSEWVDGTWRRTAYAVGQIKDRLNEVDQAAIKSRAELSPDTVNKLVRQLHEFVTFLEQQIGDAVGENRRVVEEAGAYVQKEFLPFIWLTENAERMYSKPRGYPGDYLMIEKIYDNVPRGTGRLGAAIDRSFLESPPCVAVRNRRRLLAEEIQQTVLNANGESARVTALACGPARELFDVFQMLEDPTRLNATAVDFDPHGLAFVAERRDQCALPHTLTLVNENLISLALGRARTKLTDQDLIYSAGLADYFNDNLVINLLNSIHASLRHGGRVLLGNFHPRNPCKAFMEHVLEWRLVHRTEADMNRLFRASAFGRPCTQIRFEEQGINLFAECRRE